jgi:hypothetical protein
MFSSLITYHTEERHRRAAAQISVLLPLLVLYLAIVVILPSSSFQGDEGGYVYNATRMVYGPAFTPQDPRLWWGPGYPLFLIPFVVFRLPWLAAKLLNAVFIWGAIIYFYALLRRYIPTTTALIVTLCLGLYPPLMRALPYLSTEDVTIFLICGLMFHFCALYNNAHRFRLHLAAASLYLGYLALTKVFFGYVIVALLAYSLVLLIWRRTRAVRTAIPVLLIALICCVPYLLHTYSLTHKLFYWGASGGMNLYFMSTPYPNEYGSWFSVKDVKERSDLAPHREFFATLEGLSEVEQDDAFKKRAIYNITHHPGKFLNNWSANVGRLLFSYPISFASHSLTTYFYLAPNMFVVVLFLFSMIPGVLRTRAIPFELWALLVFALTAFGGLTFIGPNARFFTPLVPGLCVWMAFVYVRVLRIELRTSSEIRGSHQLTLDTAP